MLRKPVSIGLASILAIGLSGCGDSGSSPAAEPQVAARLLVTESPDSAVVRLDSSALGGVQVQTEIHLVNHPWSQDSLHLRAVGDHWVLSPLPDGPWRVDATLRDRSGQVRATGSRSFLHATPFSLCGHALTVGEWVGLLGGNLVIAAGTNEGAQSGRDVVKQVLALMVLGSIDFANLSNVHWGFSNGVYAYGSNPQQVETKFAFVAAKAFGSYKAGDTLRDNITDLSSFVKNIDLSFTDGLTWDRGALFELIQGSVTFSGRTPSFSIDPTRLALTLATKVQVNRARKGLRFVADTIAFVDQPPDSLNFRISLVSTPLRSLQSSVDNGTLTFSHDGTSYTSHADGVSQLFHNSSVRLYTDTLGLAQFDGSYQADASSGAFQYHHRGVISSTSEQTTLFACDEALKDTLGVAHHSKDLTHGTFVTAHGDRIPYGLEPY